MSYLKPLPRKIGVLTLAVACLFAAFWVRSLATIDLFIHSNGDTGYKWESVNGRIELRIFSLEKIKLGRGFESRPIGYRRLVDEEIAKRLQAAKRRLDKLQQTKASVPSAQFEEFESRAKRSLRELEATLPSFAISYWAIVIPLTLLAGYLLLSA